MHYLQTLSTAALYVRTGVFKHGSPMMTVGVEPWFDLMKEYLKIEWSHFHCKYKMQFCRILILYQSNFV